MFKSTFNDTSNLQDTSRLLFSFTAFCSWDNSVNIATWLQAGWEGTWDSIPSICMYFSHVHSTLQWHSPDSLSNWYQGSVPRHKVAGAKKLTIHPHPVLRLRICAATPSVPSTLWHGVQLSTRAALPLLCWQHMILKKLVNVLHFHTHLKIKIDHH